MGKLVSAFIGVIAGFVIAHVVNRDPAGQEFFARANATLDTFVAGVRDAYRS